MKIKNVLFDVDSTLVKFEGLDYIAEKKGLTSQVEALTRQAMNGDLPMRQAMNLKMAITQPSFFELVGMGEAYVKNLVPGARETVVALQSAGIQVWLITGNFQPAVGILASYLGVPLSHVLTNELTFKADGSYLSYNADHPLANNNGKATVIQAHGSQLEAAVMVGDSVTDLDAQSVVHKFIGFGGVVVRPKVAAEAEIYIQTPDLRDILPHITSLAE